MCVIQHTYLNQHLRRRTRDIAITDAVRKDRDVVAELGSGAGGVGNADVGLEYRREKGGLSGWRRSRKKGEEEEEKAPL